MPPPRTQLTTSEAAKMIGIPLRTLQRQLRTHRIPATKLPGTTNTYLIDLAVVTYVTSLEASKRKHRLNRSRRPPANAA